MFGLRIWLSSRTLLPRCASCQLDIAQVDDIVEFDVVEGIQLIFSVLPTCGLGVVKTEILGQHGGGSDILRPRSGQKVLCLDGSRLKVQGQCHAAFSIRLYGSKVKKLPKDTDLKEASAAFCAERTVAGVPCCSKQEGQALKSTRVHTASKAGSLTGGGLTLGLS